MRNIRILRRNSPRYFERSVAALFVFSVAALLASCGKAGAPVPLKRINVRATQLSGVQRGSTVVLSWPAPDLTAKPSKVEYIDQITIYRLKEQTDQEPTLDPDDYEDSAEKIGTIGRAEIEKEASAGGILRFTDSLHLTNPKDVANVRLRYAVRYINKRGQEAPFSNSIAIEPRASVASAPTDLKVADLAQDEVGLSWTAPKSDIDGKTPADVVGYNVYRRPEKRETGLILLNPRPVTGTTFIDRDFRYKSRYIYVVRALSTGDRGLIESGDLISNEFRPMDTFAPVAPGPVSVASVNNIISLFWPSNVEHDVIGYNVYRAASADAAPENWTKLTPQPQTTMTFRDDKVTLGERYYYKVTAVDRFDNESEPSRVVSQIANP